jgi:hypothetical protein
MADWRRRKASRSRAKAQSREVETGSRQIARQTSNPEIENHVYAFALHTMYHNFVKQHGAHRMSPAMDAGVDRCLWEIGDIVKMVEDWEGANGNLSSVLNS